MKRCDAQRSAVARNETLLLAALNPPPPSKGWRMELERWSAVASSLGAVLQAMAGAGATTNPPPLNAAAAPNSGLQALADGGAVEGCVEGA